MCCGCNASNTMFGSRLLSKISKNICMVAERFLNFRLLVHSLISHSQARAHAIMGGMEQFTPSLMPYVDPSVGLTFTPAGHNAMLYKLLAICVIAISEFVFMKWAQYNQRVKQQRQQYQQQQREDEFAARVRPDTPGESTETSAQAQYPLGFDFDGLEGQDVCKQPLTKLKDLRQQLRMQQQHFNQQFEQQKQEHGQELQRVCLGMDTRDERQNLELQRLQHQLQRKQVTRFAS